MSIGGSSNLKGLFRQDGGHENSSPVPEPGSLLLGGDGGSRNFSILFILASMMAASVTRLMMAAPVSSMAVLTGL